jgi:hypothetical protein
VQQLPDRGAYLDGLLGERKAKPRKTLLQRTLEFFIGHGLKLARPADLSALDPFAGQDALGWCECMRSRPVGVSVPRPPGSEKMDPPRLASRCQRHNVSYLERHPIPPRHE